MLLLCLGVPTGRPYNVDTESALLYQGPPNTLFGYSVVLHSQGANRWLVVGAPTANWLANASVINPGAIYRCRIGKNPGRTCEQLQLGELGVEAGVSDLPTPHVDPTIGQVLERFKSPVTSRLKSLKFSVSTPSHLPSLM